jgi:hypothetical protein
MLNKAMVEHKSKDGLPAVAVTLAHSFSLDSMYTLSLVAGLGAQLSCTPANQFAQMGQHCA